MSKDYTFNPGDFVVYPAHGVGQVKEIQQTAVAGQSLDLIAINFNKEKMMLRIPLSNARKSGLRQISNASVMNDAITTLQGKAKAKRGQWSRRSQEYMTKINSGEPISVAEVVRDLYKDPAISEQTYSERQMYDFAMSRLSSEYAAVHAIQEKEAQSQIESILRSKAVKSDA
jgi:CarD family transcriptional regulator